MHQPIFGPNERVMRAAIHSAPWHQGWPATKSSRKQGVVLAPKSQKSLALKEMHRPHQSCIVVFAAGGEFKSESERPMNVTCP